VQQQQQQQQGVAPAPACEQSGGGGGDSRKVPRVGELHVGVHQQQGVHMHQQHQQHRQLHLDAAAGQHASAALEGVPAHHQQLQQNGSGVPPHAPLHASNIIPAQQASWSSGGGSRKRGREDDLPADSMVPGLVS